MTLRVLLTLALLLFASRLDAQTALPDSYTLGYYAVGTTTPVQTESFPASAVTCNQVPPTTTNTVNGTRAIWDDPAVAARVCIYTSPVGGILRSLPIGTYDARIRGVSVTTGPGPESASSPFSRQALLPAPTGLRIIP